MTQIDFSLQIEKDYFWCTVWLLSSRHVYKDHILEMLYGALDDDRHV